MPDNHTPTKPLPAGVGLAHGGPFTLQQRGELVGRVRRILSGDRSKEWPAALLAVPREITDRVRDSLKTCPMPPSEEYVRRQAERVYLYELFAPQPVACLRTTEGLAVLAAGTEQVNALLADLAPAERSEMQVISLEPAMIRGL